MAAGTRRVVDVTPEGRTERVIEAAGLVLLALGWVIVAFSARSALTMALGVLLGLTLVFLGRKLRR